MLANIIIVFFLIGIFCIICYVPAVFAKSIYKMDHGELTPAEKVISKIPILNTIVAEHTYTGKISFMMLADIFFVFTFLLRYFTKESLAGTITAKLTILLLIISVLAIWVANSYVVFIILHDNDAKSLSGCIVSSIFFTLGQYYIATEMEADLAAIAKNRETFGW